MQTEVSLRPHNTLALQARARAYARVSDSAGILDALQWARAEGLPVVPLGEGSNLVLAGDLEALVLQLVGGGVQRLREHGDAVELRVHAGQGWHALVEWALGEGLHGLENLALIPGHTGAAPIQNIGAYGVELSSVLQAVHGYDLEDGSEFTLAAAECALGYRDSVFKHQLRDRVVITAVDLQLSRRWHPVLEYPALAAALERVDSPTPQEVFAAVVNIRRSKLPDPAQLPNAGSFFKNPVLEADRAQALRQRFEGLPGYAQDDGRIKLPAAWLIDHCGFKGCRRGGVGVHPQHALVLVNYGTDSGAELLGLAREIEAEVARVFDVALEIEPRVYGAAA